MWWTRLVLRSNWESRRPDQPDDIDAAASDVEPRPIDEGALSVFKAADEGEAHRIALLQAMTNGKPKTVDYLLIPPECFDLPGLQVVHDPSDDQHPS
jgi:hypothetical protein